jgi:hypothetical protein
MTREDYKIYPRVTSNMEYTNIINHSMHIKNGHLALKACPSLEILTIGTERSIFATKYQLL